MSIYSSGQQPFLTPIMMTPNSSNYENASAAGNTTKADGASDANAHEIFACVLIALSILLIAILICLHYPVYRKLKLNEMHRKVKTASFVSFLVALVFSWTVLMAAVLSPPQGLACHVIAALEFAAGMVFATSAVFESVLMYFLFIRIWSLHKSSFKWVFALPPWVISLVAAILLAVSSPELYRTQELRCWPSRALFYYGMGIPAAVCVGVSGSVVIMVIVTSFCQAESPVARRTAAKVGRKAGRMLTSLLLLVVLWGVSFEAFHTGYAVFYYLMGVSHLALVTLTIRRSLARNARRQWLRMLQSYTRQCLPPDSQEGIALRNCSRQRETN